MANLESNYENGNNIFPKYFVNCKKNIWWLLTFSLWLAIWITASALGICFWLCDMQNTSAGEVLSLDEEHWENCAACGAREDKHWTYSWALRPGSVRTVGGEMA